MGRIKMGYAQKVKNTNPKPNANSVYVALWVEDENGKNERCIMISEKDFESLPWITIPSCYDSSKMKLGRLYASKFDKKEIYLCNIVDFNNEKRIYRITRNKLKLFERLANSNQEDIPSRGVLNNLLD